MAFTLKTNRENIHAYFQQVRDKYPELTLDDFEHVITSAFNFFRKTIEAGHNQAIYIKFLGKFLPFKPFKIKDEKSQEASQREE